MKKLLAVLLVLCMIFSLAACGGAKMTEESYSELKTAIDAESVIATNARVVTDSNGAKMLVADIQNNGDTTVSEIVVCFAAWNAEGAPMAIKTKRNPENEIFEFQMDVTDVSVEAGKTWSENKGLYLADDAPEIATAKVVIVSCKKGEEVYENPNYTAWKEAHFQQTLEEYMK